MLYAVAELAVGEEGEQTGRAVGADGRWGEKLTDVVNWKDDRILYPSVNRER
jgi:hypothetical protein